MLIECFIHQAPRGPNQKLVSIQSHEPISASFQFDSLGVTFHGKTGVSVDHYVICDRNLFYNFQNFIVKEPTYLSDHGLLVTWLNL